MVAKGGIMKPTKRGLIIVGLSLFYLSLFLLLASLSANEASRHTPAAAQRAGIHKVK